MSLRSMALGALVLSLPVAVEVPTSRDSGNGHGGETRITVVGGVGRYAIVDRGCEGPVIRTHPVRFREAGGSIEHRFSNRLGLGLRGGVVHEKKESSFIVIDYSTYPYRESLAVMISEADIAYANPSVAFETRRLGVGAGWIWGEDKLRFESGGSDLSRLPSAHLRIGPLDRAYFKLGLMESVPLYAGGGFADIGFGGRPHRLWDIYAGINGGPFDGGGLGLKLDYCVRPHWAITGRARLGQSGGEPQNAVGVGLIYTSLSPGARPP